MVTVAVLLATHNGAKFVGSQIASLKDNHTAFTLHWLDDHSTDNTHAIVRESARTAGIEIREWSDGEHQGVPGAFFALLERVEADIYLFCDQDDVWEPGKIDATVAALLPDLTVPVLCFSDPLMFSDDNREVLHRFSSVVGANIQKSLQASRALMPTLGPGHTQGFTRSLRELFLVHKDIARRYAPMHDSWLYLIAVAAGRVRMLTNTPTTLYRQHPGNFSSFAFGSAGIAKIWRLHQWFRQAISRQAEGFLLAAPMLPPGPMRDRLVPLARLVATVNKRQSPAELIRLAYKGAMWASTRRTAWFVVACLCSDAKS